MDLSESICLRQTLSNKSIYKEETMNKTAICLFSGGLDSVLAIRVMQEQGIECIPLNFTSPFFGVRDTNLHERYGFNTPIRNVDVTDEFLAMLRNPPHGYGSAMNPCVDCKILIMSKAKSMLSELNASFIVSGEVLGQRPMSQQRDSMHVIARDAGIEDILLRPLSAHLLEPTLPEREGVVDRSKLLSFSGRGRKPQMELAAHFGIDTYEQPAGGCILTEPQFITRIQDYLDNNKNEDIIALRLLRLGRHYRIGENKIVVGRNDRENKQNMTMAQSGDIIISPKVCMGPTTIIHNCAGQHILNDIIEMAAQITLCYTDCDTDQCEFLIGDDKVITVHRLPREAFAMYRLNK